MLTTGGAAPVRALSWLAVSLLRLAISEWVQLNWLVIKLAVCKTLARLKTTVVCSVLA